MRIYVASSWRNQQQPLVVARLREEKHLVYDFRDPNAGFHWSQIDPNWQDWTPGRFRANLEHPLAMEGFAADFHAMHQSDTFVLVMPCGRSAHLELGWAAGAGKRTIILLSDGEPELMYKMADRICVSLDEVVECLKR